MTTDNSARPMSQITFADFKEVFEQMQPKPDPAKERESMRDWFAGAAMGGGLVQSSYPEWQLKAWFGDRSGLTREQIAARASYAMADAMLAERGRS